MTTPTQKVKYAVKAKAWRDANPDEARARVAKSGKLYRKKYPLRVKLQGVCASGRTRLMKLKREPHRPTIQEAVEWAETAILEGCFYCKVKLTPAKFQVDHATPLSLGGDHVISNWRLCCGPCNRAKGDMTEQEFQQLRELIATWPDGGKGIIRRLRMGHF